MVALRGLESVLVDYAKRKQRRLTFLLGDRWQIVRDRRDMVCDKRNERLCKFEEDSCLPELQIEGSYFHLVVVTTFAQLPLIFL